MDDLEDVDLDLEPFGERHERLGTRNPRLEALGHSEVGLERPVEGAAQHLEAVRLVLVDALLDQDDHALRFAAEMLHRVRAQWLAIDPTAEPENRGELRGLHNIASMALERITPLAILAELEPEGVLQEMLVHISENQGCSNDDIVHTLDGHKETVSRAGRRLREIGLAKSRRLGRRNSWEITPRGLATLASLKGGGRARPTRRNRAAA